MTINTNSIISISEANQNFSKAARLAERTGQAVRTKKEQSYGF